MLYAHAVLRRALKQAMRWGMIPRNPCDAADPPKAGRDEMKPLDREQARQLISVSRSDGDRLEALWLLALHTGMRPGELLGLKWEDVELEARTLLVRRTLSPQGVFAAPKTVRRRGRIDSHFRKHRSAQAPSQSTARGAPGLRRAVARSGTRISFQLRHASLTPQRRACLQVAAEASRAA